MFEAVFPMLNPFAHIPVCGLISMYNATTALSSGPILLPHMMRAILTKRLTFRGFIVRARSSAKTLRPGFFCAEEPAGRWFLAARACQREGIERACNYWITACAARCRVAQG